MNTLNSKHLEEVKSTLQYQKERSTIEEQRRDKIILEKWAQSIGLTVRKEQFVIEEGKMCYRMGTVKLMPTPAGTVKLMPTPASVEGEVTAYYTISTMIGLRPGHALHHEEIYHLSALAKILEIAD